MYLQQFTQFCFAHRRHSANICWIKECVSCPRQESSSLRNFSRCQHLFHNGLLTSIVNDSYHFQSPCTLLPRGNALPVIFWPHTTLRERQYFKHLTVRETWSKSNATSKWQSGFELQLSKHDTSSCSTEWRLSTHLPLPTRLHSRGRNQGPSKQQSPH